MMSRVIYARDICREIGINQKGGGELFSIKEVIEARIKKFQDKLTDLAKKANEGKIHLINWELDVKEIEEQIKLDKKVIHEVQKLMDAQKRDLQELMDRLAGYSEEELENARRYTRF